MYFLTKSYKIVFIHAACGALQQIISTPLIFRTNIALPHGCLNARASNLAAAKEYQSQARRGYCYPRPLSMGAL